MAQGKLLIDERKSEVNGLQVALEEIAQSMGMRFEIDRARADLFEARRAEGAYGALEAVRKRA